MEKQWKGILWSHFLWRLKGNYNCFLLGKICLEAFSKLDLKEVTFFTFALCNISDIFFFLISNPSRGCLDKSFYPYTEGCIVDA